MCYIELAYKYLLCDDKIMQTALTPNRHNAPVCLFPLWACIYKTGAASPLQIRSGCAVCTLTAHKQETGIFHKQEEKTNMNKRILCILLAIIMVVGLLPAAAFAAEGSDAARFPYRYDARNGETAVKLSHPQVAPNASTGSRRTNDGLVDYAGNGVLSADIGSADDSGCRGQSYSWSAIGYGDWIYTGLLYNALGQTVQLMDSGLGHKYDPELLPGILNVIFNGDFFTQEADGKTSSGALVKLNVKTGEVKILLSSSSEGNAKHDVSFRNAVEYHGKFYFCGSVDHAPQIWQVDPETDECKKVYGMDVREFYEGFQQHISAGIRGMCVYEDELIISCVMKNEDGVFAPQICSTTDPEKGFTVIATQEQLFNYPAFHFSDSIYGGSIWEIVEFNNKLYVSICTGTPENMPGENTMQSFAIVCGEKQSDGSWNWRPVVGDTEKDGAKYTFGIDPARTCSGAGVLTVLGDHLYIGEYNDEEIALIQIMFNLDFAFMNENLKQSVNLYRMDKAERIELVVGDKTEMFPEGSLSGLGSGFGHNENQYIWRMTVHNNKLYCGTFDTSSLLEPVGQFSNGDLASWTPEEWHRLFVYVRELLKLLREKDDSGEGNALSDAEQAREDVGTLFEVFDTAALSAIDDDRDGAAALLTAEDDLLAQALAELPEDCFRTRSGSANEAAIAEALEASFGGTAGFALGGEDEDDNGLYDWEDLAKFMQELIEIARKVVVTAAYMNRAERGCDIFVSEDGTNFETITTDGFGDPYNHGLRVFAETDEGLGFGTANPFYGTQWWYTVDTAAPQTYSVTVNGSHAQTTGAGTYKEGDTVSIFAGSRSGYAFDGWTSEDVTVADAAASSTQFKMPARNVTVTAAWRELGGSGSGSGSGTGSTASVYPIVVLDSKNGGVTASHKSAAAGTTITLTAKADKGFALQSLTARDSRGKELKLTAEGGGKYTFTMPGSQVTVTAVFAGGASFTDVPAGSYYEDAVIWAVSNGITTGVSASRFDPDGICTRAQAVAFLWRAAGSPAPASRTMPFTDVPAGSYYYDAVLWAVENDITKGTSAATFSPDATCSRAQIVTFLWRTRNAPAVGSSNPFADVAAAAYYADAVLWAVKNDVTKGTSSTLFSPDANCTRAQIVTFIYRAFAE